MKYFVSLLLLVLLSTGDLWSQETRTKGLTNTKHSFFVFWGYNRSTYANSDIHFKGDNYDFTLFDVPAHDLPEEFTVDGYMNPLNITIPQFNARVGFFIAEKYAISTGWDHSKYQTLNDAEVRISGTISPEASPEFAGTYNNDLVKPNHSTFIRIEHSDGLNLIQLNIERHDILFMNPQQSMGLSTIAGSGIIFPMPWTNAKIFGIRSDDRPHFTGVGASVSGGIKFNFLSRLYLQALGQAGYLHLPGIVITPRGRSERASQNIKYLQGMVVLGYTFRLF